MRKIGILLIIAALIWWGWRDDSRVALTPTASLVEPSREATEGRARARVDEKRAKLVAPAMTAAPSAPKVAAVSAKSANTGAKNKKEVTLPYALDEGLVVVHGDVVLGRPADEDAPEEGLVEWAPVRPWKSREVAYHIQPSLPNPERVLEAIEMFNGTALRFVPFTDEEDVLVFQEAQGVCKSYVGSVGGKQPVWLPKDCGSAEVAHEIMHALGFVHEQNREDRDEAIVVNFDNIDEKHRANFEKLPSGFMALSGLGSFDFESLMIYPDDMFAKTSSPTMRPKEKDRRIAPGKTLSLSDIMRINEFFARQPQRAPPKH